MATMTPERRWNPAAGSFTCGCGRGLPCPVAALAGKTMVLPTIAPAPAAVDPPVAPLLSWRAWRLFDRHGG